MIISHREKLINIGIRYIEHGKTVIPVAGKKPLVNWREFQERDTTIDNLRSWFAEKSLTGLAMIPKNGDIVIDFDDPEVWEKFLAKCHIDLPIQRTRKGFHIAFNTTKHILKQNLNGIDIIANNGYVLIAGSQHPDGGEYKATKGNFFEIPFVHETTANQILDTVRQLGKKDLIEEFNKNHSCESVLLKNGYQKVGDRFLPPGSTSGIPGGVILDGKYFAHNGSDALANGHCNDAFELYSKLEYGGDKQQALRSLKPQKLGDLKHATELFNRHGAVLRYCASHDWLFWNGTRWETDAKLGAKYLALNLSEIYTNRMNGNCISKEYHKERLSRDTELLRQANYCSSNRGSENILNAAKTIPGFKCDIGDFDADDDLINLKNGAYRLSDGTFHPHSPEHMVTKIADVAFNPEASCPKWIEFQNHICGGDESLVRFKQVMYGVSLSGLSVQKFFVLYGTGANGKSTELRVLGDLLGDYAAAVDMDVFTHEEKNSFVMSEIARTKGVRLVVANESKENARYNTATIKRLTGDDTISTRKLYKETFEFKPKFKVFTATNHKPRVVDTGDGIWRRMKVVPYPVKIPQEQQKHNLIKELLSEREGILNWLIDGFNLYRQLGNNFPPCRAVEGETNGYRSDSDNVLKFIKDCCVVDPKSRITAARLHQEFCAWCEEEGVSPMSKRKLGARLSELGYGDAVGTGGIRIREGLRLREDCG